MAMTVDVVSTTAQLWRGEATSVVVPAANGDLGIMTGHQPLLAVLRPGTVRVTPESGSAIEVRVAEGFVSVDEDAVTIVVDNDGADRPSDDRTEK